MGCDIHISVEHLDDMTNVWVDSNLYKLVHGCGVNANSSKLRVVSPMAHPNYTLFAILAGVRNTYNVKPICGAKGLPKDACSATVAMYEELGSDAHDCSYFTFRELLNVREDYKQITYGGYINKGQAEALDLNGVIPSTWSTLTWGVRHGEDVYRTWFDEGPLDDFIEDLKAYIKLYNRGYLFDDYEDTYRIVFWFDS